MAQFEGNWMLVESQNYGALLERLGIWRTVRKMSAATNHYMTIKFIAPDQMTVINKSSLCEVQYTFRFGEEFEYDDATGRRVTAVFELVSPNKLIEKQRLPQTTFEIVREVFGDTIFMSAKYKDVSCSRKYTRHDGQD
ncbi:14 kDa fatty acid-binding protein [Clonorchis sinensis]|uniref:14 kDa fatty acid-binding protein n=2 Tax=Clonorchis sinensis TaxID=79923 RepID=A0A8T1MT29_CLOSI|nr:14 kDa fatty acid-binding protein [Clonorchis sinensis]